MKKRNKALVITSILFLVVALLVFILSWVITGGKTFEDFLKLFNTPMAYTVYAVLALYVIVVGSLLASDLIKRI